MSYNVDMYGMPTTQHRTILLYSTFYLALAGVAARGLQIYFSNDLEWRWVAAGLILVFAWLAATCHWPIARLWRYPHFYLALQTGLVAALLLLPPHVEPWGILYFLLSAQAMLMFPQRIGFLWIGVFAAVMAGSILYAVGWRDGIAISVVLGAGYFFFGAFATATAQAESARRRSQALLLELQEAHSKLQEYASQAEELAVAQERNRLARVLHDSVTQTIFSMTLTAESARIMLQRDPKRVEPQLVRLQELAPGALAEMRSLLYELRPTAVGEEGLVPALRKHLDTLRSRDGLTVDLHVDGERRLPKDQEEGIFRIVQEALNNVSKHAQTDRAMVTLRMVDGLASLLIEDQGAGFDPSAVQPREGHMGLASIRERVEIQRGTFKIESQSGRGTRIIVKVPINRGGQGDG